MLKTTAFLREKTRSTSDASGFYAAKTNLYNWRRELFDPDCYGDVSDDTSCPLLSPDAFWYDRQGNKNGYTRSEMKFLGGSSYMQRGHTGRIDGETVRLSELYKSSLCSDDEMLEFFDETVLQNIEQEELRYLSELAYRDIADAEYYGECYPKTNQWDMEPGLLSGTSMWNPLCEVDCMNRKQVPYQGDRSKWNRITRRSQGTNANQRQPFFTNTTQRKKHPEPGKRWQPKQSPKEAEAREVSSKLTSKKCGTKHVVDKNSQRVFLGGLPLDMTERALRQELAAHGYKVLKRPKILRSFAPEVLMGSVKEANELVERGVILIKGTEVQVRPFNSFMKKSERKKIPNVGKRSVFLGGLASGTTVKDIKEVLVKMGVTVVNYPLLKVGYARQVILETVLQAEILIKMKKVLINGRFVEVKPFLGPQRKRTTKTL